MSNIIYLCVHCRKKHEFLEEIKMCELASNDDLDYDGILEYMSLKLDLEYKVKIREK
jgi:hypothetical protein